LAMATSSAILADVSVAVALDQLQAQPTIRKLRMLVKPEYVNLQSACP